MSDESLENKKILIGISGGIAMYKICSLVRLLVRNRVQVKVVMTENATKFISPLVFQSLTQSPVYVSMFNPIRLGFNDLKHIKLAKWLDIFILAPATANTIGKITNGIADNLLTTVISALPEKIPLIVIPAMNVNMWKNVFVQENIKKLRKRNNCYIVGPIKGRLASGEIGEGRMVEIEEIFKITKKLLLK
ncbi:hypothetical protein KJA15_01165 [Patescibacteria group bacterium]|nr:hypothetical protein [Patescibacteria group bacterium]